MTGLNPDPGLAGILGEASGAFEAIRRHCRRYEDRSPDLFAAFMSAAVAAADGRDAVLAAGARPAGRPGASRLGGPEPGADPHEAADLVAALAAVLAARLEHAAGLAKTPQDRQACAGAAAAARQVRQLLAGAGDGHAG